jgi:hypothetical protein
VPSVITLDCLSSMSDFFEDCELRPYCDGLLPWTVRWLKQLDWLTRHEVFHHLVQEKPHEFMVAIANLLGPDELMDGWATGVPPPPVIILPPVPSVITLD